MIGINEITLNQATLEDAVFEYIQKRTITPNNSTLKINYSGSDLSTSSSYTWTFKMLINKVPT